MSLSLQILIRSHLLKWSINRVCDESLNSENISSSTLKYIIKSEVNVTSQVASVEHRKIAFQNLKSLYEKLELQAKEIFLLGTFSQDFSPPGLRGEVVKWFGQCVLRNIELETPLETFRNQRLKFLARRFFTLKDEEETEILDEADYIVAAINTFGLILR